MASTRQQQSLLRAIGDIPWAWLKDEKWRQRTFHGLYPYDAYLPYECLAREGFVYTGSGLRGDDSVICWFCGSRKMGWRRSDVIPDVHRELCPECSMVTGLNCNNVPLSEAPLEGVTAAPLEWATAPYPVEGATAAYPLEGATAAYPLEGATAASTSSVQDPSKLPHEEIPRSLSGITLRADIIWNRDLIEKCGIIPMNSYYALFEHRLESFMMLSTNERVARLDHGETRWLKRLQENLKILFSIREELAEAGFHYRGFGQIDAIAHCFCCGGGIIIKESFRNAWVEHARFYPKCSFLRLMMPDSFRTAVTTLHRRPGPATPISMAKVIEEMGPAAKTFQVVSLDALRKLPQNWLCSICTSKQRAGIFLPCGHLVVCEECVFKRRNCSVCGKAVEYFFPVLKV